MESCFFVAFCYKKPPQKGKNMKFKGKDVNIIIIALVVVFAAVIIFAPSLSGNNSSSKAESGNDSLNYNSEYENEECYMPVTDSGSGFSAEQYKKNVLVNAKTLFNVAWGNYKNATGLNATVSGSVEAIFDGKVVNKTVWQSIKATKIINPDGTAYAEAVSYSSDSTGVKTAEQIYVKAKKAKYRTTSNVNSDLGVSYGGWSNEITTPSSYQTKLGKEVGRIGHIITAKTITSATATMITEADGINRVKQEADGTYTVVITLDPKTAGANYAKEIARTSGNKYSVAWFEKLQLTCHIDENFNFTAIDYYEVYYMSEVLGVNPKTILRTTETFHSFNQQTAIPDSKNLPA